MKSKLLYELTGSSNPTRTQKTEAGIMIFFALFGLSGLTALEVLRTDNVASTERTLVQASDVYKVPIQVAIANATTVQKDFVDIVNHNYLNPIKHHIRRAKDMECTDYETSQRSIQQAITKLHQLERYLNHIDEYNSTHFDFDESVYDQLIDGKSIRSVIHTLGKKIEDLGVKPQHHIRPQRPKIKINVPIASKDLAALQSSFLD